MTFCDVCNNPSRYCKCKRSLSDEISYIDKFHVKVGTDNSNEILLVSKVKKALIEFNEKIWHLPSDNERQWLEDRLHEVFGKKLCVEDMLGEQNEN